MGGAFFTNGSWNNKHITSMWCALVKALRHAYPAGSEYVGQVNEYLIRFPL